MILKVMDYKDVNWFECDYARFEEVDEQIFKKINFELKFNNSYKENDKVRKYYRITLKQKQKETFIGLCNCECYLMNDNGKTIDKIKRPTQLTVEMSYFTY